MAQYMYIAYGSNLHFRQMRHRCPNSVYLGSGYLKNAELLFRGKHGNCFCTVQLNRRGKQVPIGIFLIDERDLVNLDRYEGYPVHYRKELIKPSRVIITNWLNDEVKLTDSIIYVMNSGEYGAPSSSYLYVVYEGYQNCNLDDWYLREAYRESLQRHAKRRR